MLSRKENQNIVLFPPKEQLSLYVGDCKITGIPFKDSRISTTDFENLIKIVEYAHQNNVQEVYFSPFLFNGNSKEQVVNYVMEHWLNVYYEWRKDQEKVEYFHSKLESLPKLHQSIVRLKFLELDCEGKQPLDDFVYQELHISRTHYYKKKKEAIYWLGLALISSS